MISVAGFWSPVWWQGIPLCLHRAEESWSLTCDCPAQVQRVIHGSWHTGAVLQQTYKEEGSRGKQELLLESSVGARKAVIQLVLPLCDGKRFVVCLVLLCSQHHTMKSLL